MRGEGGRILSGKGRRQKVGGVAGALGDFSRAAATPPLRSRGELVPQRVDGCC